MSSAPPTSTLAGDLSADDRLAWGACCAPCSGVCEPAATLPWLRLALGLFVAAQTMLLGLAANLTPLESAQDADARRWLILGMLAATVLVMLMLGPPLAADALRSLARRRPTMELLFLTGMAGSFALSLHSFWRGDGPVYFETVAVLLVVYWVGRSITSHSRQRALAAVGRLSQDLARARRVENARGDQPRIVPTRQVRIGELLQVLPGELVPVDGRITRGQALVQDAAFTGQWQAVPRGPGDAVLAGSQVEDGDLMLEARSAGDDRRVDRLVAAVEEAMRRPAAIHRLADRFVGWFLPIVLVTACLAAAYWWQRSGDPHRGLHIGLAVLLVACPCAAGLATPLVLWTAAARLAQRGLVLRGGTALELLALADSVIFDKTGTLAEEQLALEEVRFVEGGVGPAVTAAVIQAVQRRSTHPIAAAMRGIAVPPHAPVVDVLELAVHPGRGVQARVRIGGLTDGAPDARRTPTNHEVRLWRHDPGPPEGRLGIQVWIDDRLQATAVLAERVRPSAEQAMRDLARMGLAVRVMTGDAAGAAAATNLAPVQAGMSPEDKVAAVRELRRQDPAFQRPIFVGDALNDAPAMAQAHASVALAHGAAVTVASASATLHGGNLGLVPAAVAQARRALLTARTNLAWAVAYNCLGMTLAAGGLLHPIAAALLMAASSALVSWRSLRNGPPSAPTSKPLPAAPATDPSSSHQLGAPAAEPLIVAGAGQRRAFAGLHALGLLGQAVLLARIADLSALPAAGLLLAAAALTWAALAAWRRLPEWADMTLGMVTLGGLGMAAGWWIDLGFMPATPARPCCGWIEALPGAGPAMLLTWMNAGMLLLGVPAMFLVRHSRPPFRWRRWCCGGMLLVGVPGMVVGMAAGSALARALAEHWPAQAGLLLDYLLMMAGMVAGMLVPHALGQLQPRRRQD